MENEQRSALPEEKRDPLSSSALVFADDETMSRLTGSNDENLRIVEQSFPVRLIARGNRILVCGEDATSIDTTTLLLEQLHKLARKGHRIHTADIKYAIEMIVQNGKVDLSPIYTDVICTTARGKPVRPRTAGQKEYIDAMRGNDIVFGIGPAGTGKTYLAVCQAVSLLKSSAISRIVLVRPAVEAGESLGFLPGDLREKVEPYLRPLYDAFYDLFSPERFLRYVEKNVIEIAPLAYMRGRTLNDSFIILDEAQNTTPEQMKMFLTRIGFGSRAVVTGDVTQIDLPKGAASGLIEAERVLKRVQGIAMTRFTSADVVRHPLVARIVDAYDAAARPGNLRKAGNGG